MSSNALRLMDGWTSKGESLYVRVSQSEELINGPWQKQIGVTGVTARVDSGSVHTRVTVESNPENLRKCRASIPIGHIVTSCPARPAEGEPLKITKPAEEAFLDASVWNNLCAIASQCIPTARTAKISNITGGFRVVFSPVESIELHQTFALQSAAIPFITSIKMLATRELVVESRHIIDPLGAKAQVQEPVSSKKRKMYEEEG